MTPPAPHARVGSARAVTSDRAPLLARLLRRPAPGVRREGTSWLVDEEVAERFARDGRGPMLISFPRTGSHWFRMVLERSTGRPSLVRVFYYPWRTDYTFYHRHDLELECRADDVIYLYRDPVAVVYSVIRYHDEDLDDEAVVRRWAEHYGRHLSRWLLGAPRPARFSSLTYEQLQRDPAAGFRPVCQHLGVPFDASRLGAAIARVGDKSAAKRQTTHDPRAIIDTPDYDDQRRAFQQQRGALVWREILAHGDELAHRLRADGIVPRDRP